MEGLRRRDVEVQQPRQRQVDGHHLVELDVLVDAAQRCRATVLVLSRSAQAEDDIVLQASTLHEQGVRIRTLSLFYEQWLGKLPIGELERVSLLFDIGELHAAGYARVKRLLDIARWHRSERVFLEVRPSNPHAIALYESIGFNEFGRRPNYYPAKKGREDAVVMAMELLAAD